MSGQNGKETNNDNYWMQVLGCHYTDLRLDHQDIFSGDLSEIIKQGKRQGLRGHGV